MTEPERGAPPPPGAPAASRGDRILLAAFGAYVLLVLVAAFAQVTGNRAILDLLDLRRWFTD